MGPLRLERIEVRDAARPDASPVVTYGRSEIERTVRQGQVLGTIGNSGNSDG